MEIVVKFHNFYIGCSNLFAAPCTPYSMNSLFSELFRKFEGVFLEVCETISGDIWEVFGGKIKENHS